MRRVAVTGLGVFCAIGEDQRSFAGALEETRSGIAAIAEIETEGLLARVAAQVRGYDPLARFTPRELVLLDRATQFALIAAREALAQSGLAGSGDPGRIGAILGSGTGGGGTVEENYVNLYRNGMRRAHPMCVPKLMMNAPVSHITMEHGITGPSFMVASACASASHAIGVAYHLIRSGAIDAVVTGGTEACISHGQVKAWEGLRVMAPDTCRPFSRGRLGMVLGEGAGVLVLEEWDRAARRGADILGEVIGFAMSSDASHIVNPAAHGSSAALRACLNDARLNPEDVDYVNAHGTGTLANDQTETEAVRRVFGSHADKLMVSSTKGIHGHAIGASGALELCATILAGRHGFVPATANFVEADPACRIDCVPNEARREQVRVAVSNSFAFGGHNATLAVRCAA